MPESIRHRDLQYLDYPRVKMEELNVIKVHKSVHLRNLLLMCLQLEESIRAYVALMTATANMSNMTV